MNDSLMDDATHKHPSGQDLENLEMNRKNNESRDKENQEEELLKKLESEILQLRSLAEENRNNHLRSLADMENMRRRTDKEKIEARKFALEGFLRDAIPVLDSLDQALTPEAIAAAGEHQGVIKGFQMVQRKLIELLAKNGLTVLESVGKKFDPNLHQAIQRKESSDVTEELVEQEFVKGYLLHERLVRPAMVTVVVPTSRNHEEEKE